MLVELLQLLIPEIFVGRSWDVPNTFPERYWSLKRLVSPLPGVGARQAGAGGAGRARLVRTGRLGCEHDKC